MSHLITHGFGYDDVVRVSTGGAEGGVPPAPQTLMLQPTLEVESELRPAIHRDFRPCTCLDPDDD